MYDGIGQVASETVQENANAGGDPTVTVYQRLYGYDTAGRATASEITVGGATYLQGMSYDADGRPSVRAYPAMGGGEDRSPTVSAEADPPGPVATGRTIDLIVSGNDDVAAGGDLPVQSPRLRRSLGRMPQCFAGGW